MAGCKKICVRSYIRNRFLAAVVDSSGLCKFASGRRAAHAVRKKVDMDLVAIAEEFDTEALAKRQRKRAGRRVMPPE